MDTAIKEVDEVADTVVGEYDLRTRNGDYGSVIEPTLFHKNSIKRNSRRPTTISEKSFVLYSEIGTGGEGIVHAAEQVRLQRQVAVKSLLPEKQDKETALRLIAEARITAELDHPHIIPVYDLVLDDNNPAVMMKRISGSSWDDRLSYLTLKENVEVLLKVTEAIAYAHSKGIIHRDLKPGNVMLGEFGEVYVVDWRIAGTVESLSDGGVYGTPAYMAPEMFGSLWPNGDAPPIDCYSDVYLLGALLFHLLEGHPPHRGNSLQAVMRSAMLNETLTFETSPPLALKFLVETAMKTQPDQRPSVGAFLKCLSNFLGASGALTLVDAGDAAMSELKQGRNILLHYKEARFAYAQALIASPNLQVAKDRVSKLTKVAVEELLRVGKPQVALTLLESEESSNNPKLRKRCQRAVKKQMDGVRDEALEKRNRKFLLKWFVPFAAVTLLGSLVRMYCQRTGMPVTYALLYDGVITVVGTGAICYAARNITLSWMKTCLFVGFVLQLTEMLPAIAAVARDTDLWLVIFSRRCLGLLALLTLSMIVSRKMLVVSVLFGFSLLLDAFQVDVGSFDLVIQSLVLGSLLFVIYNISSAGVSANNRAINTGSYEETDLALK